MPPRPAPGSVVEERAGWFVAPRLAARHFSTSGASETGGLLGCSSTDAANVQGTDGDFMLGADVGYRIVWGQLWLEPIAGASVGYCWNCPGGGPFPFGGFDLFAHEPRESRTALSVNIQLLRAGFRF